MDKRYFIPNDRADYIIIIIIQVYLYDCAVADLLGLTDHLKVGVYTNKCLYLQGLRFLFEHFEFTDFFFL